MTSSDIQHENDAIPAQSFARETRPEPDRPASIATRRPARRRRGKPPAWTLWLAAKITTVRQMSSRIPQWVQVNKQKLATAAASLAAHFFLALVLGLWVLPEDYSPPFFDLIVTHAIDESEPEKIVEIRDIAQPQDIGNTFESSDLKKLLSEMNDGDKQVDMEDVLDRDISLEIEPTDAEMNKLFRKGQFGGRSKSGRTAAVRKYGGTESSEKAVSLGLNWLKSIQQEDGSWNFRDAGEGAQAGELQRTEVGATSLALLCFLGAGHTHAQEGPYQQTVREGLAYIGSQAEIAQGTADLRGASEGNGGMYVQALATICVSEAHAMDRGNRELEKLTEMAVGFIERSQNQFNGGWRYRPDSDDADTSVTGWQIMALKSARAGGIQVSSKVLREARGFLHDARADPSGSSYVYDVKRRRRSKTMSAVGLLCRIYLGWKRDHEGLTKGVKALAALGPDRNNAYFNYYATQVMHHYGGNEWKAWNDKQREQLVNTQITEGPAAGSWRVTDPHGRGPGQLYQTALSLLTLEVYYRHLPIYRRIEDDED